METNRLIFCHDLEENLRSTGTHQWWTVSVLVDGGRGSSHVMPGCQAAHRKKIREDIYTNFISIKPFTMLYVLWPILSIYMIYVHTNEEGGKEE